MDRPLDAIHTVILPLHSATTPIGDVLGTSGPVQARSRDRSLITVATLVALCRTNELRFHLKRALDNRVSRMSCSS
jgi:alkylhydroperoxidase/carboxymuconolactone decarboxylase family protein YurZ